MAGIRTLPTAWGARNSLRLLWSIDCAWLGWVVFRLLSGRLDAAHAAFLFFLGAYPFLYTGLHCFRKASKGWIDFLTESDLMFFSLGLLLLSRVH